MVFAYAFSDCRLHSKHLTRVNFAKRIRGHINLHFFETPDVNHLNHQQSAWVLSPPGSKLNMRNINRILIWLVKRSLSSQRSRRRYSWISIMKPSGMFNVREFFSLDLLARFIHSASLWPICELVLPSGPKRKEIIGLGLFVSTSSRVALDHCPWLSAVRQVTGHHASLFPETTFYCSNSCVFFVVYRVCTSSNLKSCVH